MWGPVVLQHGGTRIFPQSNVVENLEDAAATGKQRTAKLLHHQPALANGAVRDRRRRDQGNYKIRQTSPLSPNVSLASSSRPAGSTLS